MAKDKFAMSSIEKRVDELSDWMTQRELRINVDKMSIDDLADLYEQADKISDKIAKFRQAFNQSIKEPMKQAQLQLLGKAVLTKSPEELVKIQQRFVKSEKKLDQNSRDDNPDDSQGNVHFDQGQSEMQESQRY